MIDETLNLLVILGSNRPGRVGERVGKWVLKSLEAHPEFKVDFADAFIIVTPEYNHGYSAILKHAIDSVYAEWFTKAGAIVSYGAASVFKSVVDELFWWGSALKSARVATPYPA